MKTYEVFFTNKKLSINCIHKIKSRSNSEDQVRKLFFLDARRNGGIFKKDIEINRIKRLT